MSSKEANLLSISLKQYFYKLKANTGLLNRLIITQIFALFLSLVGGSGMRSSSNGELSVSLKTYSASTVIFFSLLWIVIVAIFLTTKQYKKIEIPLVVNRLSGSLSDVGLLMTASVFAGITSSLAGVFLRVIMYFTFDRSKLVINGFVLPLSDLWLGFNSCDFIHDLNLRAGLFYRDVDSSEYGFRNISSHRNFGNSKSLSRFFLGSC